MRQGEFLSTEMTPRSWRMISYCCVGFLLYAGIVLAELLQEVRMARLDQQAKMADRLGKTVLFPSHEQGENQRQEQKNSP